MNLRLDIVSIDEKADAAAWPIRPWFRPALFCLFVWASVTSIPQSWSQEADSIASNPAPNLEFFRMYVPRKEIAGVAKGYLPIDREELNRKLELLAAQSKANAPAARLTTAKYKVALKEDSLVGDLFWQFESRVDHPAWVSLAPCRLPISQTAWQSAASDDRGSEVVIGADRKGELGLVTAESGSLSGQWERRGTLADDGSIRFSFSLPACEQSEFLLELPHHWLPSIRWSGATDTSTDSRVDAPSAAFTAVPLSTEEGEPIMQRWRLVTSGGHLAITVMHDDADHTTTVARGVYSQESTYQLSLAGIQCRTDFEFQSDLQVGSQSTLQVTPGAQILEVRSGRVTLNWRLTDQQSALGSRLEIDWPQELRRSRRFLHIQAIAPFSLDASAEIPRMVPIGFAWQQHSMTLQVDRQLQIEKLDLQDWRQVHDEQPPTRGEDQRFRFLAQSDAASLKVQVGRRQPVVTAQIGTQLLVRRATLRGTMRVHVQVSEGELYSIPLELAGLWRVDSIDCDPPDRLDTIQFSRKGKAKGSIEIRLSQPVTPNRPLALTVHAQHPGAAKLATSVFRPLSLIGIPVERYVIVDLNDGLALQTRGDALVKRFDRSARVI